MRGRPGNEASQYNSLALLTLSPKKGKGRQRETKANRRRNQFHILELYSSQSLRVPPVTSITCSSWFTTWLMSTTLFLCCTCLILQSILGGFSSHLKNKTKQKQTKNCIFKHINILYWTCNLHKIMRKCILG